ncbi:hypothetical protein FRB98_000482 [Tulasnella sp. 332]|nr:hypothetical protein FRB98_000482 [Tulasnella sp. 332]
MPSATDIITYIGVPLAVVGVMPVMYTCSTAIITRHKVLRTVQDNNVEVTTRIGILSGVIEVDFPRYTIHPHRRSDDSYWKDTDGASSLKGGSWTLLQWQKVKTGKATYRIQHSDELRQPQAEIQLTDLFTFLLDRGATPSAHGLQLLRIMGLQTPPGTVLLVCGSHPVLTVATPDESEGHLSLKLHWTDEMRVRSSESLPPYWVRVFSRKIFGDQAKNPPVRLFLGVDGLETALLEANDTILEKAEKQQEKEKDKDKEKTKTKKTGPVSLWFACAVVAICGQDQAGLFRFSIPPRILTFAKRDSIPHGLLVLLGMRNEDETPLGRERLELRNKMAHEKRSRELMDQGRRMQQMTTMSSAERQKAMAEEGQATLRRMADERRQRQVEELERRAEALSSPRISTRVVAEAAFEWLKANGHVHGGSHPEITMSYLAHSILHSMVFDKVLAVSIAGILDSWIGWTDTVINDAHCDVLRQNQADFCYAAVLLNEIAEYEINGKVHPVARDLDECQRVWKTSEAHIDEVASITYQADQDSFHQFNTTSDDDDIDLRIARCREALTLHQVDESYRLRILAELATTLKKRFELTGNMDDSGQHIHCLEEALALHPIGQSDRSSTLSQLGAALSKQFNQVGGRADLEMSIKYYLEALSLCPIGRLDRSSALNNLSLALSRRFDQTGDRADLEMSIDHHQDALPLCLIDYPDRSSTPNNIGLALSTRFEQKGDGADLERSIEYMRSDHSVDVEGYVQRFREGSEHVFSPLSDRASACRWWIRVGRRYGLESLGDAYKSSLDLVDRSLLLAASALSDAHSRLKNNQESMTEDATSYAIRKHKLATAVERGRALLFTLLENYRMPLDNLQAVNGELVDRFRALSASMEESSLSEGAARTGGANMQDQRLAAGCDQALQEIRQLDGFENFLRVTPFARLRKAADRGPVILVNISQYGSEVIIIHKAGEPISVPLPEATTDAVNELARTLHQTVGDHPDERESDKILGRILRNTWTKIVEPIVFQLENTLKLRRWSRIWWIPTSLGLVAPPACCGDIRYQTLKSMRRPRILVIAQSGAEGEQQLLHVPQEVALMRALTAEVTVVEGDKCTREAVLAGLKETAWTHFACHGNQNPTEPFKSHFSLRTRNTSLTLLDIIRTGLPQAELVVLSACHSAAGDESTPDEGIHLTAGMLFTGFRSVVGTMWAIPDEDGPAVAEESYKYMFRNGPEAADCRDASEGLTKAIGALRRRKVPLERWITICSLWHLASAL